MPLFWLRNFSEESVTRFRHQELLYTNLLVAQNTVKIHVHLILHFIKELFNTYLMRSDFHAVMLLSRNSAKVHHFGGAGAVKRSAPAPTASAMFNIARLFKNGISYVFLYTI
jgi:hypothetical protein